MEAMCETSEAMWPGVRGRPIMTLLRHARLANMAVTRLGLNTVLELSSHPISDNRKISSSISSFPNVQFLLMGFDINLIFCVLGASSSMSNINPFFSTTTIFSMRPVNQPYWSMMNKSFLRAAIMKPRLNCPQIPIMLEYSIVSLVHFQHYYCQGIKFGL